MLHDTVVIDTLIGASRPVYLYFKVQNSIVLQKQIPFTGSYSFSILPRKINTNYLNVYTCIIRKRVELETYSTLTILINYAVLRQ